MSENTNGFRGNPALKMPGTTEKVTPEEFAHRMSELDKIYNDIIYFAKNYFTIVSTDKGECLIDPYPKQAELIKAMKDKRRVIALSCRQSGKCLLPTTYIKIRNKKTNKIEKITIGDFFNRISHFKFYQETSDEEKQKAIRQKVSCKDYDDFDELKKYSICTDYYLYLLYIE